MSNPNELWFYVVYAKPKDYPDEFVCRRWLESPNLSAVGMNLFARAETLEALREKLPEGLANIGRETGDDPCIAEVWV